MRRWFRERGSTNMAHLVLGNRGIGHERLQELLSRLMLHLQALFQDKLHKVVLYGSYARGDEDIESDLDILVLVTEKPDKLKKYDESLLDISVDMSLEYGLVLSIRTKSCLEYEKYVQFVPFYKNVEREGILLYG